MKGNRHHNFFIFLTFCITSCVKPYEPAEIKADHHFLVVDGVINSGPGSATTIILSRTRRLTDTVLFIPEVNAQVLTANDKIIANPNCSTIQMVVALQPLHQKYKIKRVVVSTYQSVTGTGKKAVDQLFNERDGKEGEMAYKYQIDLNAIPQIDVFLEKG